ncbi:MAG TPA: hypothetical protein VFX43_21100 [Chitinophagaceae bacterium]|nr:hypothetical protein [Chitinophagaceae bacterium]
MRKCSVSLLLMCLCVMAHAQHQDTAESSHQGFHYKPPAERHHPVQGVYAAGGSDGSILSFAHVKNHGDRITNSMRFSLFFNIGCTANYDFSNHAGFFSGVNLKNIGFITREDDLKIKRRLYSLGIPAGFKFGNFNDDFFFYLGGQYEWALNYKEKHFVQGKKVLKFNEWFSDRTPLLLPSLFAGIKMHNFNVKVQYYPGNFFNTGFHEIKGGLETMPYKDIGAHIFFVSFGYSFKIKDG